MSLNDSGAIILIIGALTVLGFVVHGLWFSGRRVNRRLQRNSKEDLEIAKSDAWGKVRIVTAETRDGGEIPADGMPKASDDRVPVRAEAEGESREFGVADTYELNVFCEPQREFTGEEIAEICDKYGFYRGESDLLYVYENPSTKENVVFRICSLKKPYAFPKDLKGYTTPAIAVYMTLPAKGKAAPYFKATRQAAEIFVNTLGGRIQDNSYRDLSPEDLDAITARLQQYDGTADGAVRVGD